MRNSERESTHRNSSHSGGRSNTKCRGSDSRGDPAEHCSRILGLVADVIDPRTLMCEKMNGTP